MLDKNNYQNNIKQFRVRERLTQEELAKKINISRQMIGLIENNKTIPSVEIALKLSKVLKEPIENLFEVLKTFQSKQIFEKISKPIT